MMPPIIQGMMPPAGFEPTNSLRKTDLKSVAFDHSAKMAREGGPNKSGPDGIGVSLFMSLSDSYTFSIMGELLWFEYRY